MSTVLPIDFTFNNMLKSRKATITLLVAVLIIWAFIGLKFYNALKAPTIEVLQQSDSIQQFIKQEEFNYTISAPATDPFLGKITSNSKMNIKSKPVNRKSTIKVTPNNNVAWPSMIYKGVIQNNSTGKALASLSINGKDIFLKKGDTEQDITLVRLLKDSVEVSFKSEKRFILRDKNIH